MKTTLAQKIEIEVKAYADTLEEIATDWDALSEYFEDILDVEFIIGGRGDYRGAIITLACGDPVITFDTRDGVVKGSWGWGVDKYSRQIDSNDKICIDDYFSEMWDMVRGY